MTDKRSKFSQEYSHRTSSGQMDPRWESYLESNERLNPKQGLEAPLLDPLDPFMLPKSLPRATLGALQRYGRLAAEAAARSVERGSPLTALANPAYVVKNKGGNWLQGSVEDALRGLKESTRELPPGYRVERQGNRTITLDPQGRVHDVAEGFDPYALNATEQALNTWIDKQLTRYVKNDMATPEDPIRALAEQGTLHYNPRVVYEGSPMEDRNELRRVIGGFPKHGVAKQPLGQLWESHSDQAVAPKFARDLSSQERAASFGGRTDIDPLTRIYQADLHQLGGAASGDALGFDHLIDELSNALNPESGLPRHLQLTADKLNKVSVPQAVQRVADINAWRAAQKVEANRKLAEQASIVREYAENNPKGLRWVELKHQEVTPESLPEGWELRDATDKFGFRTGLFKKGTQEAQIFGNSPEEVVYEGTKRGLFKEPLERQLKYEGDTMGHCVGGYCPDVLEGRSRIFSLRDAKGEPHVTVEVSPADIRMRGNAPQDFAREHPELVSTKDMQDVLGQVRWNRQIIEKPEFQEWLRARPPSIVQIKGKANRAPNEEYLPFVQDFVRNSPLGGTWSDVGDFHNTKLYRKIDLPAKEHQWLPKDQEYFTLDEIKAMREANQRPWTPLDNTPEFAHGGHVQKQPTPTDSFQGIIAALEQELA